MLRNLRYRLEYLAFQIIACVFSTLSWRQSVWVSHRLAGLITRLPKKMTRHQVAVENLKQAFGDDYTDEERDEIVYQMWVHLFRMICEIIQLPRKLRLYNCADVMSFKHRDETVKTLSTGRPVLVLSGHFGNWEMAISAFGMFGFPLGVVARDLDNPYLHRWFQRFRESTGHRLISKNGGGAEMTTFLENRSHLGLLADQDAGKRGLFVDFFGKPASTFKSIALLAMEYDALIVVGYARRMPDEFEERRWVHFEQGSAAIIDPRDYTEADALRRMTEDYTKALERVVRLSPEQYFWVHRRWKSEPKAKKQKQAA